MNIREITSPTNSLLKVFRRALADGTVRDLVSRNLRRFVDRGIIRLERRKVIVLNLAELEAQIAGAKRASG